MTNEEILASTNIICKNWHNKATSEYTNESAIDNMHGAWMMAINTIDNSADVRDVIDTWQDKCRDRRGSFAKAEADAYNARKENSDE